MSIQIETRYGRQKKFTIARRTTLKYLLKLPPALIVGLNTGSLPRNANIIHCSASGIEVEPSNYQIIWQFRLPHTGTRGPLYKLIKFNMNPGLL